MAETKWTPGPWEVKPVELGVPYLRVRGTRLGMRHKVANVLATHDHPAIREREIAETEANAHLIAAAPDLYEALETTVAALASSGSMHQKALDAAEAALSKARGEMAR